MKLGTLTTGAAVQTTIKLEFVPAVIFYVAATQLTSLLITADDQDWTVDLATKGLSSIGKMNIIGPVTNGYIIPLANGIVSGQRCTMVFTNSAAQTPDIYGYWDQEATVFIQSKSQQVLSSSGADIKNFSFLTLPDMAATDQMNITFRSGKVVKTERADLQYIKGMKKYIANGVDDYVVDNMNSDIKNVNYVPASDAVVFIQRLVPIKLK